jgi:general secretion pathway protein G
MIRPTARPRRFGFTMIELLVVIVILAILIALLLPAIQGAYRRANEASVDAEINQMAQALADFKNKYGDYPPSRILLSENGYYNTSDTNQIFLLNETTGGNTYPVGADITYGQLAQRSITYLRKFFPRVVLSTSGRVWPASPGAPPYPTGTLWYDFNGDGIYQDDPLGRGTLIQGDQCLAFFLGGIAVKTSTSTSSGSVTTIAMTGFGKTPQNPFSNSLQSDPNYVDASKNALPNPMYNANRTPPLFEFKGGRLADIYGNNLPVYFDTMGQNKPYIYFSAYGGNSYDPNDVNYSEPDSTAAVQTIARAWIVNFPVVPGPWNGNRTTPSIAYSPSPNPYTTNSPVSQPVTYQSPQTFQIISSGRDGRYGLGGLYDNSSTATQPLPLPDLADTNTTDANVRNFEHDNLTNFNNGRLQ